MNGGSKIVVVGLILIVGVAAALPFQRDPKSPTKKNATRQPDIELRSHDIIHQPVATGTTPALSLYEEEKEHTGETQPVAKFNPPKLVPLPSMAPTYKPLIDIERQVEPQSAQTRKVDLPMLPQSVDDDSQEADSEAEIANLKRHEIVDGDSLESIAQRYLGDPGRASEVFNWNLAVLSDPQLLPIGKFLRIPPRKKAAPPQPTPAQSPNSPSQSVKPTSARPTNAPNERTKMVTIPSG